MAVFGKALADYLRFVRTALFLIVVVGVARFLVGISGVPYERASHLVSMTVATTLLALVHGERARARGFGSYRHLLPVAALLAFTMYGFIIVAILIEGLFGLNGYFHAPGRGLAPAHMGMGVHITGQLLVMIVMIFGLWGVSSLGYLLSARLRYLGKARA